MKKAIIALFALPLLGPAALLQADSFDMASTSWTLINNYLDISWPVFYIDTTGWGTVTVDSPGSTGKSPSLALDASKRPHIAYMDVDNGNLKYAYWNGSAWVVETVDTEGVTGGTPSIDMDASGKPHISYFDYTNDDLRYAYKNASDAWVKQTVESSGRVGIYSSIKLAGDSKAHIAYYDLTNANLKYAKQNSSATWAIETVDSANDVGQYASLELTSSGDPRIAYLDWSNKRLRYASKNGSASWSKETVDSTNWVGYYASLELDSNNKPHIAYQDATNQNLKYAKKTGSSWQFDVVDATGDVGEFASLALDSSNKAHVSYYDVSNNRLKYAKKTDSGWSLSSLNLTSPGSSPISISSYNYTAIAVDSNGTPHIAYQDFVPDDLKYSRLSPRPWLNWPQEPGYTSDGLEPEQGNNYTPFAFRIRYSDVDDEPPLAGYPKVHVKKGNQEVNGSPFSLSPQGGNDISSGVIYGANITVPVDGNDLSYYFEAYDIWGVAAWLTATKNGPQVTVTQVTGIEEAYSYPNPVTSANATFHFVVRYVEPVIDLKIFDIVGELVRSIAFEEIPKTSAPTYEYSWDLKDLSGQGLASGTYIWMLQAKDKVTGKEAKVIKKLAILK